MELALETAMRRGEILGMEWEHIDLKSRTVHIPITKTDIPRTAPLSLKAIELLFALPDKTGRVFDLAPYSVTQAFRRSCRREGIEKLRFHDLRHEATTRLFEKGLNPVEVASITGHRDTRMLMRYTHLKAEDLAVKLQ
jgi:integrase